MAQFRKNVTGDQYRSQLVTVVSLLAISLTMLSMGSLAASNIGSISDRSQAAPSLNCAKDPCQITLKKLATLSPKGYSIRIPVPYVAQDNRGRFLTSTSDPYQIAVFDSAGRFLRAVSLGQGAPRSTTVLLPTQTSLLAWVSSSKQVLVINDDLTAAPSSIRIPYLPSFVRPDGGIVVTQQIQEPNLIGNPVHLVSPDGEVKKSFGADPPEYRDDLRLFMERVAAPAADGSIWTSAKGRYILEKWNPVNGARLARLPVHSSWFIESSNYPANQNARPRPIIQALWERQGLLWVLIRDADANWKPSTEAERSWSPSTITTIYDWVMEAVDPSSGAVLASLRSGSPIIGRPPQAFVVSYANDPPDGLELLTPVLSRKEKTP